MSTYLSLSDLVKSKGPDGNMLTIAEVLEREVPIVGDAPWIEANDTFSNLSTRRSALPTGSWRKFYEGVAPERSQKTQHRDVIGMLESESVADCKLIDAYPNPAQARSDEDVAFAQGFSQTMASAILYSDTITAPEKFTGLAPRLNALATTTNVLNEGGSGSDLTSIFIVTWSPQTVFMAYPKGSMAGLQVDPMPGKQRVLDGSGNAFMAYITRFSWDAGMVVRDPRAIGRIANIESAGASNIFDEDNVITLLNRMTVGAGTRIYMNETVQTQAEIRLKDKSNVNWSVEDGLGGAPLYRFRGIPVRKIDSTILLNTESANP
jgi:hypothetical protein